VVLIVNDLCDVATNYVCEQLTTHADQDALTCPWPTLDIRNDLPSGPYSSSGYSVETAPAPNGPWTASAATPFLQDGQNGVVIPADSDQRSFQLYRP